MSLPQAEAVSDVVAPAEPLVGGAGSVRLEQTPIEEIGWLVLTGRETLSGGRREARTKSGLGVAWLATALSEEADSSRLGVEERRDLIRSFVLIRLKRP